jgi:hypothetical protein
VFTSVLRTGGGKLSRRLITGGGKRGLTFTIRLFAGSGKRSLTLAGGFLTDSG